MHYLYLGKSRGGGTFLKSESEVSYNRRGGGAQQKGRRGQHNSGEKEQGTAGIETHDVGLYDGERRKGGERGIRGKEEKEKKIVGECY